MCSVNVKNGQSKCQFLDSSKLDFYIFLWSHAVICSNSHICKRMDSFDTGTQHFLPKEMEKN